MWLVVMALTFPARAERPLTLHEALVAAVANIWLQLPALHLAISAMAVLIFSAFIMYDIKRIIDGGETNYVTATLSIYLNVYNVFSSLLQLLMAFAGGDRE